MRALLAGLTLLAAVATAWAGSPLVGELQAFSIDTTKNPGRSTSSKLPWRKPRRPSPTPTRSSPRQVCFMYGDVRATTEDAKLAAMIGGARREARHRACPEERSAQFWYGTNTGRGGRPRASCDRCSSFPRSRRHAAALALDPGYAPAYALGGSIYYEVPGYAGGDLDRSRPCSARPRARAAGYQHAPRSCAHASQEGPHRRRPPRARGGARREGAQQSRGLDHQDMPQAKHPRRDKGRS